MPDPVDLAESSIEMELLSNLHAAKKRVAPKLEAVGVCHNCMDVIRGGLLFCAPVAGTFSECQTDYEQRTKRGLR